MSLVRVWVRSTQSQASSSNVTVVAVTFGVKISEPYLGNDTLTTAGVACKMDVEKTTNIAPLSQAHVKTLVT